MRSYGPRFDPDGVIQHAPVAQAHSYDDVIVIWRRTFANGSITCRLLKAPGWGSAHRLVDLVAEYEEGDGTSVTQIVRCDGQDDENYQAARLEAIIRYSRQVTTIEAPLR